jgi:hypothetical protein
MTMTDREKLEYCYHVFLTKVSGPEFVGWIFARQEQMPFKPECYGIFGMRQVAVFGISYEVLR